MIRPVLAESSVCVPRFFKARFPVAICKPISTVLENSAIDSQLSRGEWMVVGTSVEFRHSDLRGLPTLEFGAQIVERTCTFGKQHRNEKIS